MPNETLAVLKTWSNSSLNGARGLDIAYSVQVAKEGTLDTRDYPNFNLHSRSGSSFSLKSLSTDGDGELIHDRHWNGRVKIDEVIGRPSKTGINAKFVSKPLNPGTYNIHLSAAPWWESIGNELNPPRIDQEIVLGTMVDFNGDGRTDFLRQEKGVWDDDTFNTANVFLSNGIGSFTQISLPESLALKGDLTNLYMGDFNGDGRTDFLRQEKGAWDDDDFNTANIFLSNGNGRFTEVSLPESLALKGDLTNLHIGDFNGDGRTDFLRQEQGAWDDDDFNTANVFLSNGNGRFTEVPLPEDFALKGDLTNLYMGDFNGDGKTDFLRQEKGAWDDDDFNTANVFLSNGDGSFTQILLPESLALKGDLTNLYMGDFNGDGKTDFLRQEKSGWDDDAFNTANVFLSNGIGSFTQISLPESLALKGDLTNLYMGDFNGDGRTDFLRQEKGAWDDDDFNTANVFLSNGDGSFTQVLLPESLALKGDLTNLYMGDFNGDGKTDFLRQEKGAWDNDAFKTANVFLSNGIGSFIKALLPEYFALKGDLTYIFSNNQDLANRELLKPTTPVGQWLVQYYDNSDLSGDPTYTGYDNQIDYDWGQGNPGFGVSSDNFSTRWTGTFNFENSNYQFHASVDDGMRVWIDGDLIHDTWNGRDALDYAVDRTMSAGNHTIMVEYRELGLDALAKFSWDRTLPGSSLPPIPQTAAEFSQLSSYTTDNIFWKSGYAPGALNPPGGTKLGSSLGNCTWYAHGRLRQLGYDPITLNLMSGDATQWDNQATGSGAIFSNTPQVGAIAQWESSNGFGHVAVVEQVNPNGSIVISESSFDIGQNGGADNYLIKTATIQPGAQGGPAVRYPDRFIIVPHA